MSFDRVNGSSWGIGDKLTSSQLNQLDENVSNAADKRSGQTETIMASWLYQATAVFTGLAAFGSTMVASGAVNLLGDVKLAGPVSVVGTSTFSGVANIMREATVATGATMRVATGATLDLEGSSTINRGGASAKLPIAWGSAGRVFTNISSLLSQAGSGYANVASCSVDLAVEVGDVLEIAGKLEMQQSAGQSVVGVHVTDGGVDVLVPAALLWKIDTDRHWYDFAGHHVVQSQGTATVKYMAYKPLGSGGGTLTVQQGTISVRQLR